VSLQPAPEPVRVRSGQRTLKWWEKLVPSARRRAEQEFAAEAAAARAAAELAEREHRQRILDVIDTEVDHHRITVSSLKGGVTKTTTVLGLGTALAMHRRSSVTAVDGNPHRGTLAERLGEEHAKTVRDLIDNAPQIHTSSQFRQFTNVAKSRLEVIAAHKDPRKAQVFTAEEYRLVTDIITRFRPLLITDTGTDLLTPLMEAVYQSTDTLVVPATTAEDGWKLAAETLDWWEKTPDGEDLVRNAIVPVTVIDTFALPDPAHLPDDATLAAQLAAFTTEQQRQIAMVVDRIGPRVGKIVMIPHDPKLKRGNLFEWDALQQATRDAYLELAYEVTSRFPGATPPPAAPERAMPARAW